MSESTYAKFALAARTSLSPKPASFGVLQLKCARGGSSSAQSEAKEKVTTLQRQQNSHTAPDRIPSIVQEVLRVPGQPLEAETRAFFEPRFGHDFSRVRIHTDAKAADSARAVDALAYTVGSEIVFGTAQYAPATMEGKMLLAHELTHVMQQNGNPAGQGETVLGEASDLYEREADRASSQIFSGMETSPSPGQENVGHVASGPPWHHRPARCEVRWQPRQPAFRGRPIITHGAPPRLQRQRVTTLPDVTVRVSERERARILKGSGWRQVDIIMTIVNFRGEPMTGFHAFAQFRAPGVAMQEENADIEGGSVFWSGVWLKPDGTLRLAAISMGAATVAPEGVTLYHLPDKGPMEFKAVQKSRQVTVAAKTSQEAASKVGAKGTMGVDFEVVKVGGEVSGEESQTKGTEVSVTWNVILPEAAFDLVQVR